MYSFLDHVIIQIQAGETALHFAAKYSHLEALEMLLDKKATIDEQNIVCQCNCKIEAQVCSSIY